MGRGTASALIALLLVSCGATQPPRARRPPLRAAPAPPSEPDRFEVEVFELDAEHCYRIPAAVRARAAVWAFVERRHGWGDNRCSDHGNIDIVARTSRDGGRTWGATRVIVDHRDFLAGGYSAATNPSPVAEPDGTIRLLFNVSRDRDGQGNSQGRVQDGDAAVERLAFEQVIAPDGSLGERSELTEALRAGRWYAFGPGHGVALARCEGRLAVPGYYNTGERVTSYSTVFLFDDDDACGDAPGAERRWFRGGVTSDRTREGSTSSESQVAELADGTLVLNSRRILTDARSRRRVARSEDHGLTFGPSEEDAALVSPISHGSVLAVGDTLLFANPACNATGDGPRFSLRRQMAVRASDDGGRTWPHAAVIREGSAGYPDLVDLGGGRVGLLYEAPDEAEREPPADRYEPGWYQNGVVFTAFDASWIDHGPPVRACDASTL